MGLSRFWRRGARLAGVTVAAVAASTLVVGAAVAGPPPGDTTTTTTAPETTTTTTTAASETTTTAPGAPGPGQGDVGALAAHQVTNGTDADPGSYRAAIIAANSDSGAVTINFDPGLTVNLSTADVVYTNAQPITLNGNGSTIDGADLHQILDAQATTSITVNNLTMQNGESPDRGGAIDGLLAAITLNNSTFTSNAAAFDGGAIDTVFGVAVSNSTFTGNTAGIDGGAIESNNNSFTITNSTFTSNTAGTDGGALRTSGGNYMISNSTFTGNTATAGDGGATATSNQGSYTVSNSTFSGNTAGTVGGAAFNTNGSQIHSNTTFTGNTAGITGGALLAASGGDITLVYATVVSNTAPDGANVSTGALTSFGSVVALPLGGGPNCDLNMTTSHGWNFSDDTSCGFTDAGRGDNQAVGNNPQLGALASNGGPTQTLLPQSGSPLINPIPGANCQDFEAAGITTDQRGVFRPQGPGCDIGAVEVAAAACPAAAQSSLVGPASLAGAEGVVAVAPIGIQLLMRRRRMRSGGRPRPPRPSRHQRVRSVLTWVMVAGVAVAVLAACQPVKKTPPIC